MIPVAKKNGLAGIRPPPGPVAVLAVMFCLCLGIAAMQARGAEGGLIPFTVSEGTSIAIALSPDHRELVFDLQGALYKMPADGGEARQIIDPFYDARQPSWSPDGRQLAFQSNHGGHLRIWVAGANGEDPHPLSTDAFDEREPAWSPDGRSIAFTSTRSGKFDIWARTLSDGSLRRLSPGPGGNSRASWSLDGTEVAYLSDRGDSSGVYVANLAGEERKAAGIRFPGGPNIAPAGVPTWTPDGKDLLYVTFESARARLMRGNDVFLEGEDFHPFRVQWLSEREFLYTADGKIKRRSLDGGAARVIPFRATLAVRKAQYRRRQHDLLPDRPRQVHGVQRAVLSPDGRQIAFTALGALWVMPLDGEPRRLTQEGPFVVVDPAWSPDGTRIAYATDRGGSLDIWVLDAGSGSTTRITRAPGAQLRPAWSPDGARIAYVDAFGGYVEQLHVVELESGVDRRIDAAGRSPGYPVWMPDGRSVLVSTYIGQSKTLDYLVGGVNQAAIVPVDGGEAKPLMLVPGKPIGNRSGDGPVVSPDGRTFVYQLGSALWAQSTQDHDGVFDPPRKLADLITTGQSWSADSRWLLVNAGNLMHLFDMRSGQSRRLALPLTWRGYREPGVTTIRAGLLVDGVASSARADMDIVVADGRIRAIHPHGTRAPEGRYVDASGLTVMPGLVDTHQHLIKEYGATYGLLNLAYGITTVRSPGNVPGDVVEEREALASGQRPGPNMLVTGYILDGDQTIWEMGTAVSLEEVDRQIALARDLDYDLIKSYMHTSEPLRRKIVEAAHAAGMPVTGHDIYPAALMGMDSSEHLFVAGSGRGYSGKVSNLQHVYDDVVQILARSGMSNAPTLTLFTPSAEVVDHDPVLAAARWQLQPAWVRNARRFSSGDVEGGAVMLANVRQSMARLHEAGARLVVGTDTPLVIAGISTHNELVQMSKAGIANHDVLRAATLVGAEVLGVADQVGSIEPGKIADLVFVEGDPLEDVRNASRIRKVMKSGHLYAIEDLVRFPAPATTVVAGQAVAATAAAGSLLLPSVIQGTTGTALEQVDEVTARIEAMLASGGLTAGNLMRHVIFLKAGAQEPARVFTKLIGNLRRMDATLTNNPTAGTIVLVPSFPDPRTQVMVEFVGGEMPEGGMNRVPIMFGPRMSVESTGNGRFVTSFGLEGLDFYGAATRRELDRLSTLDGEMDKLVAVLAANMSHAGLSIADVVQYNLYVTRGTDPGEAVRKLDQYVRARMPDAGGMPGAGTVVVVDGATLPDLKVQLNVIASRGGQHDVAFIGATGSALPEAADQARDVARRLADALHAAGELKPSDVARFDVYVRDGHDATQALARFNEVLQAIDADFDPGRAAAVVVMVDGFGEDAAWFKAGAIAAGKRGGGR